MNNKFTIDVNKFLDLVGKETYSYKGRMVVVAEYREFTLVLDRHCYSFRIDGIDYNVKNKPYHLLSIEEIGSLYSKLADVLNLHYGFIGLRVVVKEF